MSEHTPTSAAIELQGRAMRVTYRPGESLAIRGDGVARTYEESQLVVERVSAGHLVSVADGTFALLLPDVPREGGGIAAVAITPSSTRVGWSASDLQGEAGSDAARASRDALVRSVSGASREGLAGVAGKVAGVLGSVVSVNVAADQLIDPGSDDPEHPHEEPGDPDEGTTVADDGDLPDGITILAHLDDPPLLDDEPGPDVPDYGVGYPSPVDDPLGGPDDVSDLPPGLT